METRYLILGGLAAIAFATGGTLMFLAFGAVHAFLRDPEVALAKLFGSLLNGRAAYFCAACGEAHILPALHTREDGKPDWEAGRDNGFLERVVHKGQPLLVLVERVAERCGQPLLNVLVALLTREEREQALAALNGTGSDPVVDAMPGDEERNELRAALARTALRSWVSPFPLALAEIEALVSSGPLLPSPDMRGYVARLNPAERDQLYAELARAEHEDPGTKPPVEGLMHRLAGLLEHAVGRPSPAVPVPNPVMAACEAASA